jgi:hypothetical protein
MPVRISSAQACLPCQLQQHSCCTPRAGCLGLLWYTAAMSLCLHGHFGCRDSFTNMLWNSFDNATDLSRYVEISKWTAGGQYAPSFPLGILQAGILNWLKRSKQAQPAPILFIGLCKHGGRMLACQTAALPYLVLSAPPPPPTHTCYIQQLSCCFSSRCPYRLCGENDVMAKSRIPASK